MKKLAAVLVVVCVAGSSAFGAFGDVWQGFQHNVGLNGGFNWSVGAGGGGFDLSLGVTNIQAASGPSATAGQSLIGSFAVNGGGGGDGATIAVAQNITSLGTDGSEPFGVPGFAGQVQDIGTNVNPMTQAQGASIGSTQGISRQLGPGGAGGENTLRLFQVQGASNNLGTAGETSIIAAAQDSHVGGGATGIGVINTGITSTISQVQGVN